MYYGKYLLIDFCLHFPLTKEMWYICIQYSIEDTFLIFSSYRTMSDVLFSHCLFYIFAQINISGN